jgi:heat shock protein HslJ
MAFAAVLGLATCRPGGSGATEEPAAAPTRDDLANAVYEGIYSEPVRLQDGRWEGEPLVPEGTPRPSLQLLDGLSASGDLDEDGREETVVLLTETSGGSGSYVYIAAVGRRDGKLVNLGTDLVGDRVQVLAMRRAGGRVELDVIQQGPEDAACCPTQKVRRAWALTTEGLIEVSSSVLGTLSIADLAGREWVLTQLAWGEPAPSTPSITLAFADDRISGTAGCNRYVGTVNEPAPGALTVERVSSAREACSTEAMELEARYLAALSGVVGYAFLAGKLALTYIQGDVTETLLFSPREPTEETPPQPSDTIRR